MYLAPSFRMEGSQVKVKTVPAQGLPTLRITSNMVRTPFLKSQNEKKEQNNKKKREMQGEVGSNPSSPSFKEGVQSPGIHVVPSRHCSSSGGSSGVQTGFGKKCLHLFFFCLFYFFLPFFFLWRRPHAVSATFDQASGGL